MSDVVVAAIVGAVGVVLAALIARSDRRADSRYEALSTKVEVLGHIFDETTNALREDIRYGLSDITVRIDRLYELLAGQATPPAEGRPAPPRARREP